MMLWGIRLRVKLVTAAMLLTALPVVFAQQERFRERQVLDPNTDQWVEYEPQGPEEGVAGDTVDQARGHLADGRPGKARAVLRKWTKNNPDDERYYEALLLLGDSFYESRDFWKAQKQYEQVADNAAGEVFELANRRTIDVARAFLSGQKRIVWMILRLPAYAEALELLDKVWERVPGSRLGEVALKIKADYYYGHGDVDLAQEEYANLVRQYPSGRFLQLSMLRSAEASEAAFPGIKFDDQPLVEADERYRQVLAAFPTYAEREELPARLDGIRAQRAEKDLYVAKWYEKTRQTGAAEFYYRQILKDWPDTIAAHEARTRLRARGVIADEGPAEEAR
jgi:TolA-binding protein